MSPKIDKHDVIRHLQKQGKSLSSIAQDAGYSDSLCRLAFLRPQLAGERLIIEATGFKANHIWPDRYNSRGERTVSRGKRNRATQQRQRQAASESLTPVCCYANDRLEVAS